MAAKYYTILTQTGKAKVANAAALGRQIKLTHLAVGDGNGSEYDPTEDQTSLLGENYRTPISNLGTDEQNPNWVIAEGMIPVDVGSWFVREVGLFDEDGDLFAIGKYPETYKPTLAEGTGRDLYIRFIMVVSNTETIDMKIDPTVAIATKEWVEKNYLPINEKHITAIPGVSFDTSVDNRDVLYSNPNSIYIPEGLTIRCNFLPTDDVRKFKGEGRVLTRDQWGNEHVFDVGLANNGPKFTPKQVIAQAIYTNDRCNIGVVGDSITDGAWGDRFGDGDWTPNPTGSDYNLSSTNHDHTWNGGSGSWFASFGKALQLVSKFQGSFKFCNASSSGKQLADGWAYRNIDHGFFKNAAYDNKMPDVVMLAMGVNDNGRFGTFENYLDKFDAFIRKAWGYGSTVVLVSVTRHHLAYKSLESAIKDRLTQLHPMLDFVDLGYVQDRLNADCGKYNLHDLYYKTQGGANVYDLVHAQGPVYQLMGAYAAKELARPFVFVVGEDGMGLDLSIIAQRRVIAWPSNTELDVELEHISDANYLKNSALGIVEPNNENIIITVPVWCDKWGLSGSLSGPLPQVTASSYNGNNYAKHRLNDPRNSEAFMGSGPYSVVESTLNNDSICSDVSYIPQFGLGMNFLEFTVGGNPSKCYMPTIEFNDEGHYSEVPIYYSPSRGGYISGTYSNAINVHYKLFDPNRTVCAKNESLSYLPDSSSNGYPWEVFGTFQRCSVGAGVIFCVKTNKDGDETGLALIREADSSGNAVFGAYMIIGQTKTRVGGMTIPLDDVEGSEFKAKRNVTEKSAYLYLTSRTKSTQYVKIVNKGCVGRGGLPLALISTDDTAAICSVSNVTVGII
jgi:hypothetical protein